MDNRGKIKDGGHSTASARDCPNQLNDELKGLVEHGGNLFISVLEGYEGIDLTFAYSYLGAGCFNLTNYHLQNEDGEFRPGSDPCFIGDYDGDNHAQSTLYHLSNSAGINFYLAQAIYRFSKQHDPQMYRDLVSGEKNYFNTLYWLKDGLKQHCPLTVMLDNKLALAAKTYWQVATEIVDLEQAVENSRCPEPLKNIYHNELSNKYVKLAVEEQDHSSAYHWLLQKAYAHVKASGNEHKQAVLLGYVNLEDNEETKVCHRVFEHFFQQTAAGKEALLEQFTLLDENVTKDRHENSSALEVGPSDNTGLRRRLISNAKTATTFGRGGDSQELLKSPLGPEQNVTKVSAH